jgi:hypothetical protein
VLIPVEEVWYIDLSPRQYVSVVTILCLLLDIAPQGICIRGGSRGGRTRRAPLLKLEKI